MDVVSWIAFGLVAGSFAKLVMPGPSAGGLAVAIPVGIGGALFGGFSHAFIPNSTALGFDFHSLLMAMATSLFGLLIYRSYAMRSIA